jgi:MATE family multidrug resistance protein
VTVPSLREPRSEVSLRHLAAIAFPMIVSQGSETIMLFFNRYFVSFLGSDHIPASMSGGLSQYVFTAFFTGIVGYVNALAAQYHGAGKDERGVQSVSQGLWLSLAFTPMLLALIPLVHRGFAWAGHTDAQVALEFAYFRVLMFGSLLYLFQAVLTGFFVGIGRTRMVMIANVIGIFVNVPLNWALVLGRLGIPSLGIEGAAIGTLAGTLCIVSILLAAYLRSPEWRAYGGPGAWRFQWDLAGRLLRFGTPAGAELLVNVFAFNVFVQLMHGYGPAVASAVTITFNYDLVAFIPMLGIGSAVTALVGQRIGAGDLPGARRTAFLGLRVAWSYAGVMMIAFVAGAPVLVRVFAHGFTSADEAILPLAETLLRLAAVYTLADATQVVFSGALRGAGDTTWVMIISGILHWLLAVAAFILIRIVVLSPVAVWLVYIGFVVSLGVSMWLRHRFGGWERIRLVEVSPAALP